MKYVLIAASFFSLSGWAAPCPNLSGVWEAKVGELVNRLEIKQEDCAGFEFITTNSAGSETKRAIRTDGAKREMFSNGRRTEFWAAQMVPVRVGNQNLVALRIDVTETDIFLEQTTTEIAMFYSESGGAVRTLVERRDVRGDDGERLGRLYIGYADASRK